MALDVYVGPVSRYLADDWQNVAPRAAARGIEYRIVRPEGRGEALLGGEAWRAAIAELRTQAGAEGPLWDDAPDRPYFTDRLGWEGMVALILRYAYLLHPELEEPAFVPEPEALANDPAYRRASAEPGLFTVLGGATMWLPGEPDALYLAPSPRGETVLASSVAVLNVALDTVCGLWGQDRTELERTPTDQPGSGAPLDGAACHGLAVLGRLAALAAEHELPVLLDG